MSDLVYELEEWLRADFLPGCVPNTTKLIERSKRAIDAADALRSAQRAYLADRGNNDKGAAVGKAAEAYDAARREQA